MKKLLTIFAAALFTASAFADSATPVAAYWRNRNTINVNDVTDFASLYISDYGTNITSDPQYSDSGSKLEFLWEKSTDGGSSWVTYTDGKGYNTNNIRPIKIGKYRCVLSYTPNGGTKVSYNSNVIDVTASSTSTSVTVSSNIPIVIIRTDKEALPVEPAVTNGFLSSNQAMFNAKKKISADVKIIWNGEKKDGNTDIYNGSELDGASGKLYYDKKIRFSYRGSSSLAPDKLKKNYAFVVGDDSCTTGGTWIKDKEKMFKLSDKKDKDWILYGAWDDRPDNSGKPGTLVRNNLQLALYEDMTGSWNSHTRYVRLFVDGVDKGIYIFMEKNKEGSARINVDDDGFIFKYDKTDRVDRVENPETGLTDPNTGGALVGAYNTFRGKYAGQLDVNTYNLWIDHAFELVFPEYEGSSASDLAEWKSSTINTIKSKINAIEDAIKGNQYATMQQLLDYESFADYFIIEELAKNVDGYRISQYFYYKNASSKLMAEPLWDTELGIKNHTSSDADKTDGLLMLSNKGGGANPYEDDFPIPFWWTGYTGYGKSGKIGTEMSGSANTKVQVDGSNGLMGDPCFKAKIKQRWQKHRAEGGALTASNINSYLSSYSKSLKSSTSVVNSVFPEWFYGNASATDVEGTSGRIYQLNSIIDEYNEIITAVAIGIKSSAATEVEKELGETVTLVATATKTDASSGETLTYKWEKSSDKGKNWAVIDGATASEYTATIEDNTWFRVRAIPGTCDCIKKVSDNVVKVTIPNTVVTCK